MMRAFFQLGFSYNFADVVEERTVPIPEPKENEVRVKIIHAAFNPVDTKSLTGMAKKVMKIPFPVIMGRDFSGVVDALPSGETEYNGFKVGQRVAMFVPATDRNYKMGGTFAEYVVVDPKELAIVPPQLGMQEAAALPLVSQVTYQALVGKGGMKPVASSSDSSGKILVLGGSTACGLLSLALAKRYGYSEIVATSSNNADLCRKFGATEVINYKTTNWAETLKGRNFDYVYDTAEGVTGWNGAKAVLKPSGGHYISIVPDYPNHEFGYGAVLGFLSGLVGRKIMSNFGGPRYDVLLSVSPDPAQGYNYFAELSAKGQLPSIIDPSSPYAFTKEGVLAALNRQHRQQAKGKLIMNVDPSTQG